MGNSFFNEYPYTDFHELNLSWVVKELRTFATTLDQFVAINALKYADPIQWDITRQYEKNTIVIDPLTGIAYISVQPVPKGVALTRDEYWTVVFDLGSFVTRAAKNFTDRWESQWTLNATFSSSVGDWLVWNDTLYKVISNIIPGDQYVIDSNIRHFTLEDLIGHLENLATTDKDSLVSAINELHWGIVDNRQHLINTAKGITLHFENGDATEATFSSVIGDLLLWGYELYEVTAPIAIGDTYTEGTNIAAITLEDIIGNLKSLDTTDKGSLVSAINELHWGIIDNRDNIGDLQDLDTGDKSSIVNAVNEVRGGLVETRHRLFSKIGANILLMGDSYMTSTQAATPNIFATTFKADMQAANLYNYAAGGAGFIRTNNDNKNFIDLLNDAINDTSFNNDDIDLIVIGFTPDNDAGVIGLTQTQMNTAVANFKSIANGAFKNASIIAFSNLYNTNPITLTVKYNTAVYHNMALNLNSIANCDYGHEWFYNLDHATYDSPDNVHLTDRGYTELAAYMTAFIRGGDARKSSVFTATITETTHTGWIKILLKDGLFEVFGEITATDPDANITPLTVLGAITDPLFIPDFPADLLFTPGGGTPSNENNACNIHTDGTIFYLGNTHPWYSGVYRIRGSYPLSPYYNGVAPT